MEKSDRDLNFEMLTNRLRVLQNLCIEGDDQIKSLDLLVDKIYSPEAQIKITLSRAEDLVTRITKARSKLEEDLLYLKNFIHCAEQSLEKKDENELSKYLQLSDHALQIFLKSIESLVAEVQVLGQTLQYHIKPEEN